MNDPERKKSYLEQIDGDAAAGMAGEAVDLAVDMLDTGPDLADVVVGIIGAVFEGLAS